MSPPKEEGLIHAGLAEQREFFRQIGDAGQWRQLLEHIPDVYFFLKDRRSRLMAAGRGILERFGLGSEQEIIGTTDFDYFPPHVAEGFVRDDRRVLETGEPLINRVEIWYTEQRLPDWYLTTKLPLRGIDGKILGIMGTVRRYADHRRSRSSDEPVERVVRRIRNAHGLPVAVADLAAEAGLSPRQLNRRFRSAFGMSVQDFVMKTRLQAAAERLLQEETGIASVSQEFGFCDQSAFTRHFRHHVGMTPFQFRRKHRGR